MEDGEEMDSRIGRSIEDRSLLIRVRSTVVSHLAGVCVGQARPGQVPTPQNRKEERSTYAKF